MRTEDVGTYHCGTCGGYLEAVLEPDGSAHYARAVCSSCGRWADWIKRPEPQPETIAASRPIRQDDRELFEAENATLVSETPKALLVSFEGSRDQHWIPRSQVDAELSDLPGEEHGSLVVSRWFAGKAGWTR